MYTAEIGLRVQILLDHFLSAKPLLAFIEEHWSCFQERLKRIGPNGYNKVKLLSDDSLFGMIFLAL